MAAASRSHSWGAVSTVSSSSSTCFNPDTNTSVCLICNTVLTSSWSQNSNEWLEDVRVLFRLFDMDSGAMPFVTDADILSHNPYCLNCVKKVKHLNQLMVQLQAFQKLIDAYKSEIGQSIIHTFASTPNLGVSYQWKRKIAEKLSVGGSSTSRNEVIVGTPAPAQPVYDGSQSQIFTPAEETEPNTQEIVLHSRDSLVENFDDAPGLYAESEVKVGNQSSSKTNKLKARARLKHPTSAGNSLRQEVLKSQSTECPFCSKVFSVPLNLARHITVHTGDKPYSCSYCEQRFRDSSNKKRHERRVHKTDPPDTQTKTFRCDICGAEFRCYENMYSHKRYSHLGKKRAGTEKKPSECTICGKVMSNRRNLHTHTRLVHDLRFKTKYCPICGRPGKTTRDILSHQQTHKSLWEQELEGKSFFYKCIACPQSFPSKVKLSVHQSFEHPDMKFPPKRASDLDVQANQSHSSERKHEAAPRVLEKRYPCRICSKPCKDNYMAKEHKNTHDPSRNCLFPYVCSICPPIFGMFRRLDEFNAHYEREHPDDLIPKLTPRNVARRPFSFACEDCPHQPVFTTRKGLGKHIRNGHPKTSGRKPSGRAKKRKRCRKSPASKDDNDDDDSNNAQQITSRSITRLKRCTATSTGKMLDCIKIEIESPNMSTDESEDEDGDGDHEEKPQPQVNLAAMKMKQYPVVRLIRLDEEDMSKKRGS